LLFAFCYVVRVERPACGRLGQGLERRSPEPGELLRGPGAIFVRMSPPRECSCLLPDDIEAGGVAPPSHHHTLPGRAGHEGASRPIGDADRATIWCPAHTAKKKRKRRPFEASPCRGRPGDWDRVRRASGERCYCAFIGARGRYYDLVNCCTNRHST